MTTRLNREQQRARILVALETGRIMTDEDISDEVGFSEFTVRDVMRELETDGIAARQKGSRKARWRLMVTKATAQPPKPKEAGFRPCLRCRNDFWSAHAGNRICTTCSALNARIPDAGAFGTPVNVRYA